jgi:hypothetical protein
MSYVTKSLFSTGYSLLLFIISTYMFVQTIIETGKQVPLYLHSISADANICGYLSDPLACIILTRLDFAEIDSFHSHWMSFVVYAIACLGPQQATASILLTVFGLFFDCLTAAFLSMEVGSGLGLLANLAHLLFEWGSQPTYPPPNVPKRLRGWRPLRTRIKTMVQVVSWVNITTVAKSAANKGAHCVSAFATAVTQVINQEHASIIQSDDDDHTQDDGPYATAVSKCRSSHESLLRIEEHRAIARARTSLWQRLLTSCNASREGIFQQHD